MDKIDKLISDLNRFETESFEDEIFHSEPEFWDGAMTLLGVVMDSLGLDRDDLGNLKRKS